MFGYKTASRLNITNILPGDAKQWSGTEQTKVHDFDCNHQNNHSPSENPKSHLWQKSPLKFHSKIQNPQDQTIDNNDIRAHAQKSVHESPVLKASQTEKQYPNNAHAPGTIQFVTAEALKENG